MSDGIKTGTRVFALLLLGVCGCSWLQSHETQVATISVDAAKCIFDTLDQHPDWSWVQTAESCALKETPALVSLFNYEKPRAMERKAARAAACK